MPENPELTSEFKSRSGWKRIAGAMVYSLAGLKTAFRREHAFRQELILVLPGILIALLLPLPGVEKVALIAVLVLVLIVELINSAIESAIDRISLERHPLSKDAKDFGSAAVALTLALAAVTWVILLYPLVVR